MSRDVANIYKFLASQSCQIKNRYRTTIIRTSNFKKGAELFEAIKVQFPNYVVWDGFDTSDERFDLRANELINKINSSEDDGIIFYMPEEWQIMWGMSSKRMFMSALSMLSGNVPHMILICKASDEFISINRQYFKLIKAVDNEVDIFVPQRVEAKYGAI
ncbi:hypothetical protein [Vibrio sp. PID17_43]|uniref:hypothetical protein n=1 Tax=Vibrio sp. PID17_43 TaxID=1583451 RepID=UPI000BFFE9AD|nr:hypothetical protein [Vibrio sp. PID17_43]PHJ42777.1 hypothetical protein AK965_05205 [Vibrio sp. PID17_43]